ncbi:hypothetical protein GFH32_09890 [Sphingobacteruim zhuxiongii]|uniref:TonB-dependent receptor n=1 Tax=Sphingobacterium zhuxiongii TaxID=2662364 RepID=A0A5Q0QAZ1_9SPHI|nr:hypothetical protein GFH32_09890 [Sphingobacterium sp. dk4302]
MRTLSLFCVLVFLVPIIGHGQDKKVDIGGRIRDAISIEPLIGVIVTAYLDDPVQVLAYATSDVEGKYHMRIPHGLKVRIKFSLLGYATQTISLEHSAIASVIFLEKEVISLQEIKIKLPKITHTKDTIRYQVDQFAGGMDRSIGDVLKKLPGIEVSDNGQIMYNGVAINRFYIEGKNLLDNQYGLAVENINFSDVNQVEVLENHQPVKVLEDIYGSDRAAINIKLKDKSKMKWIGNVSAGLGFSPLLGDMSTHTLNVSADWQSINTLKANNSGTNITKEVKQFSVEDLIDSKGKFPTWADPLQMQFTPPNLRESRYYFNESVLANSKSIWDLKKDLTAKATIEFTRDELENKMAASRTYLATDSIFHFLEHSTHRSTPNSFRLSFNLNSNIEKQFLDNTLSVSLQKEGMDVGIGGTTTNEQEGNIRRYQISNDFDFIKQFAGQKWKVRSSSLLDLYSLRGSVSYPEISAISQKAKRNSFYQDASVGTILPLKGWSFENKLGVKLNFQDMDSDLEGVIGMIGAKQGHYINELSLNLTDLYYEGILALKKEGSNMRIQFPLRYSSVAMRRKNSLGRHHEAFLLAEPSISYSRDLTTGLTLHLRASMDNEVVSDPIQYLDEPILRNYRFFTSGSDSIARNRRLSSSLGLSYRDPIAAIFGHVNMRYANNTNGLLSANRFEGPIVVREFFLSSNRGSMFNISGKIGKGFFESNTSVSLQVQYSSNSSTFEQNGQMLRQSLRSIYFNPILTTAPFSWSSLDYSGKLSYRRFGTANGWQADPSLSWINSLTLTCIPSSKIRLYTSYEYLHNEIDKDSRVQQQFLDFGARFKWRHNLELDLKGSNILNERSFGHTQFTDASINSVYYSLRPANYLCSVYYNF